MLMRSHTPVLLPGIRSSIRDCSDWAVHYSILVDIYLSQKKNANTKENGQCEAMNNNLITGYTSTSANLRKDLDGSRRSRYYKDR